MYLAGSISGIDLTLDASPYGKPASFRPSGYNEAAVRGIELCRKKDIPVNAFTVLTSRSSNRENLRGIQQFLTEHEVESWTWLPLFSVGGGAQLAKSASCIPDPWSLVTALAPAFIKPKLQHALSKQGICHASQHTIYISPEGLVSACPWALAPNGYPDPRFLLGDLRKHSLNTMLQDSWENPGCPVEWSPHGQELYA
jgi:MoaA/NifB/PqqE/SkfB family radical SAM enzyme